MGDRRAKKRRYSDLERSSALAALTANGGNLDRTAKQVGIPTTTLYNWAKGVSHPEASSNGEQKRALADLLEEVARKILADLPGKLPSSDMRGAATALGIVIDKMQLLRGKPTEIVDDLNADERAKRLACLLDAARTRGDGLPSSGDASPVVGVSEGRSGIDHDAGRDIASSLASPAVAVGSTADVDVLFPPGGQINGSFSIDPALCPAES